VSTLNALDTIRKQGAAAAWTPTRAYLIADAAADSELGLVCRAPTRSVDVKTMSVEGVISASTRSADGDILESSGVDMSAFRNTPTFDFMHDMTKPLGVAEDSDGQFTMRVEGDLIVARSFFAQSSPLAVQTFALVSEGILRGFSIRARPDWNVAEAQYDPPEKPGASQRLIGFRFPKARLINYAVVPIPDHKDCVARALSRRFDGKFLHDDIVRALKPWAAVNVPWSNGWTPDATPQVTPPETTRMSATNTPVATPPAVVSPNPTAPAATVVRSEEAPPPRSDKGASDDEAREEIPEMTPGAKAGLEVHRALSVCREMIEATGKTHDHPELKELHRAMSETIDKMRGDHQDALSKHFPDVEFDFEAHEGDTSDEDKPKEEAERALGKLIGEVRRKFWRKFAERSFSATKKIFAEVKDALPELERLRGNVVKTKKLVDKAIGRN